jgi:hypothetical protein
LSRLPALAQHDDLEPILCVHLLRRVDEKRIDLLRSLEPRKWGLQTTAPLWSDENGLRTERRFS